MRRKTGFWVQGPWRCKTIRLEQESICEGSGPSSTLVLVDGHRLAPSSNGIFVDVSVIPLAAIDRVEILTDGASAIYGSDAVGGVVNFILRKDFQGRETWASYGTGTDGSRHQETVGQSVGGSWRGGHAVGTVQYQDSGALSAGSRSFTAASVLPTDLLPESRRYSALFNVQQELAQNFTVAADVLYSHSDSLGVQSEPGLRTTLDPSINNVDASMSIEYRIAETWRIDASGTYALVDNGGADQNTPTSYSFCGTGRCPHYRDTYRVASGEVIADGSLFDGPGGTTKLAVGASYRKESSNDTFYELNEIRNFARHVSAEFAELEVPIVGRANALPALESLELSLAVRHDDYSDFGTTTNPRYGIAWKPVSSLRLRGAYSTSYRAPSAYEQLSISLPYLFQFTEASPTGGQVPILYTFYSAGLLQPERSKNWTVGIDFEPAFVEHLKFSANYFSIAYRNRILTPYFDANALSELNVYGSLITPIPNDSAAQAYINDFVSQGGAFTNYSDTPNGAGVRYLFNAYEQNAALANTSGADLSADYRFEVMSNAFGIKLSTTYINDINTFYSPGSSRANLVNTYANPLHWRGRGQVNWSRGPWSINTAVNVAGSYTDTTTIPRASIASWTTLDAQLTYALSVPKKTTLSLSCTNLFNRDPPYVVGTNQQSGSIPHTSGIHYDVGNASPLGESRTAGRARFLVGPRSC